MVFPSPTPPPEAGALLLDGRLLAGLGCLGSLSWGVNNEQACALLFLHLFRGGMGVLLCPALLRPTATLSPEASVRSQHSRTHTGSWARLGPHSRQTRTSLTMARSPWMDVILISVGSHQRAERGPGTSSGDTGGSVRGCQPGQALDHSRDAQAELRAGTTSVWLWMSTSPAFWKHPVRIVAIVSVLGWAPHGPLRRGGPKHPAEQSLSWSPVLPLRQRCAPAPSLSCCRRLSCLLLGHGGGQLLPPGARASPCRPPPRPRTNQCLLEHSHMQPSETSPRTPREPRGHQGHRPCP